MNGLFLYDYPHLYPKRTRHYTKCTKSSFLEYLIKIPKEGVHLLQKVPIFVLRNNVKATT